MSVIGDEGIEVIARGLTRSTLGTGGESSGLRLAFRVLTWTTISRQRSWEGTRSRSSSPRTRRPGRDDSPGRPSILARTTQGHGRVVLSSWEARVMGGTAREQSLAAIDRITHGPTDTFTIGDVLEELTASGTHLAQSTVRTHI